MAHPLNATEFEAQPKYDMCKWIHAYIAIRRALVNPAHAAMPVKALGAIILICDEQLSRDLEVPLTSVYGLFEAYDEWLKGPKDANDGGGSSLG